MPLQRLEIPTQTNFKSIPSLNLVGGQAETQFFEQVANEAADVNRTAKKIIDDEARVRGEQQGLQAGVKGDLSAVNGEVSPYSTAYRDAAVTSYIDSQGNSINEKLSLIEQENYYNPEGFAQNAEKLISGAMAGTPSVAAAQLKVTADTLASSKMEEIAKRTGKRNVDITDKELRTGIDNALLQSAQAAAKGDKAGQAVADARIIQLTSTMVKSGLIPQDIAPQFAQNVATERDRMTNLYAVAYSPNPEQAAAARNNMTLAEVQQALAFNSSLKNRREQDRALAEQAAGRNLNKQQADMYERASKGQAIPPEEMFAFQKKAVSLGASPESVTKQANAITKISRGETDIETNWGVVADFNRIVREEASKARAFLESNRAQIEPQKYASMMSEAVDADLFPNKTPAYQAIESDLKRAFPEVPESAVADPDTKRKISEVNVTNRRNRLAYAQQFTESVKNVGEVEASARFRPLLDNIAARSSSERGLAALDAAGMATSERDEAITVSSVTGKPLKNAANVYVSVQYKRPKVTDKTSAQEAVKAINKVRADYESLGGNINQLELDGEFSKKNINDLIVIWGLQNEQ